MNDNERRLWILNDEGLYNLYQKSRKPLKTFMKDNRKFLDEVINNVLENKKPAHYLTYGG